LRGRSRATDEAISGYLEIAIKLKNIILFQRMLNNSRLIKLDFVSWSQRLLRRATPRNDKGKMALRNDIGIVGLFISS